LASRCIVNNILVVCIAGVGAAFLICLYTDYYRSAGYLEWTITYLGAIWIGTFAGYIRCVSSPLLSPVDFSRKDQLLTGYSSHSFREAGGVAQRDVPPEQEPLLAPV
jgi:hypothetical protein